MGTPPGQPEPTQPQKQVTKMQPPAPRSESLAHTWQGDTGKELLSQTRNPRIGRTDTSSFHHHLDNLEPSASAQRNPNSIPQSRSRHELQRSPLKASIKTAMVMTKPSFGRTSSYQQPLRPAISSLFWRPQILKEPRPLFALAAPPPPPLPNEMPAPSANIIFDKLPGELRNQIYQCVFEDSNPTMDMYHNCMYKCLAIRHGTPYLKLLPGLAYVNRRTYVEAASWFLHTKTLKIRTLADLHYLEKILDFFPGDQGWNSVFGLIFTQYSYLASSPGRTVELTDYMKRCRNLQYIELRFKLEYLHMPENREAHRQHDSGNPAPGIKTAEQVAANYHLDALLDLPYLQKVSMRCVWPHNGAIRCTPRTMATFWDLQEWIAREFCKVKGVAEVTKLVPYNDPHAMGVWAVQVERYMKG